jgi:hypothetical protein
MALDPTPCPACAKTTRTIAGLCPNCGQAKPDGVVPSWIKPEARRPRPTLSDAFGGVGPYVGGGLLVGALMLAIAAAVLVETMVAVAVIAVIVLAALAIAGLLAGAGPGG